MPLPAGVMSARHACELVVGRSNTGFFTDVEQVHLVLTTYAKGEPVESKGDISSGMATQTWVGGRAPRQGDQLEPQRTEGAQHCAQAAARHGLLGGDERHDRRRHRQRRVPLLAAPAMDGRHSRQSPAGVLVTRLARRASSM
jgi:hypothetical protein